MIRAIVVVSMLLVPAFGVASGCSRTPKNAPAVGASLPEGARAKQPPPPRASVATRADADARAPDVAHEPD